MNKKILSLVLSLTMIIGTFSLAFAVPADVVGTDFEDAVVRLLDLGVLTGYPDGSFKANNNIKRSEYAAVVARAKGLEQEAINSQGSTNFGDVPANHWASGYINIAEDKGLINGLGMVGGINKFDPEANITYEQAVTIVVRALGYESEAQQNGGWPNGYLTVANQIGLLDDVNGTIGMPASRGLVAILTYNALEIPNMIKVGSNYIVSGSQGSEEVYLFNELHMINRAAANSDWTNIDAQTFTMAGILGITASNLENFKATLEILADGDNQNWTPSQIQGVFDNIGIGKKVILAKAHNASQIEIKFNTKLNAMDAVTTLPYKVSISGVTFSSVTLSEDGMSLILTASGAMNLNNAALTVEPIQTAENAVVTTERYTALFSYSDSEDAEIEEITSKTNGNMANKVSVKFSEPIQILGTVKINGAVKAPTGFTPGDDKADFTGLSLNANQTHDIQIIGLTDQASNVSSVLNETFSILVDTVLPTVILSASADKDNVIVFEFDKPITTISANAVLVNGIVKDENLASQASATATPVNPVNGLAKKFEMAVTLPFALSATRNFIVLLPAGIKDELGNELASTTKTVTLNKDIIAPEIEDIGIVKDSSENVVSLVLSVDSTLAGKLAQAPAILAGQLTVLDPNGVAVNTNAWLGGLGQDAITAGDNKVTLSFANPGKLSGIYQISFAAGLASDEADMANNLKAKSVQLDFGLTTSTGTFALTPLDVTSGGSNIYLVNYGAKVKGGITMGSATDPANYTLNGLALPVGTTISLDGTQVIATITLPAGSIAVTDPAALFTINNVQRLSGETIIPFITTVQADDNTKPVMDSAILTSDNKLIVGFSEALSALPTGTDFEIKVNGKPLLNPPVFVAGSGSDVGKYVFNFTPLILTNGTEAYIDMDNNGVYSMAIDALDAPLAGVFPPIYSMMTSAGITSVTIKVIANTTTDNAMPANNLTMGTMITVK